MESKSKAPLALMEQVIMVLVFALAAAICVQAFVMARTMSVQSKTKDRAMEMCQSVAEQCKAEHRAALPEDAYYDEMWRLNQENFTYHLEFVLDKDDETHVSGVLIMKDTQKKEIICQLKVAWQKEGTHE
ncbi:MAG: hypothetical protein E7277_07525 [Lachnospiraceae bacterium]|jgi:Tfp pilus assembly protein PilE|nr:hypothetical protein [Lachnospiraceae bacterium]